MWLTTIPCIDVPKDKNMQNIELSRQNQDNQHQNDVDHCSPFSTCNCCQSNFDITSFIVSAPATALDIKYFDQTTGFQSPVLFDFQIPPKA